MLVANYIIVVIIVVALGILYQKYSEKQALTMPNDKYAEIKKYLLKSVLKNQLFLRNN